MDAGGGIRGCLMRARPLISGPVLVGFGRLFDAAWGNPKTPGPYPKVTPSRVGDTLLPFQCPHCGKVRSVVVGKKKMRYFDPVRGFSWCPGCKGRYIVNYRGMELIGEFDPKAVHAPALVERSGKVETIGNESALEVMGAE